MENRPPENAGSRPYRRTYTWDEKNQLISSEDNRYRVSYTYGHDGERVGKYGVAMGGGSRSETLYFNKMWTVNRIDDIYIRRTFMSRGRIILLGILLASLVEQTVFGDEFVILYNLCLSNLKNYNTYGYKANIFEDDIISKYNPSTGNYEVSEGHLHFGINGKGYIAAYKENEKYYTQRGDFFYDFIEEKIVNWDGFVLELSFSPNENTDRSDIINDIVVYNIDINRCDTIENIYFKPTQNPEIENESSIVFGYLEQSNVLAFQCLLEMKKIIYSKLNIINNSDILLDNINLLINKIDNNEDKNRDANWEIIKQWIPYLELDMGS